MGKKIIISGYYGFKNFGDEAVLKTLIFQIQKNIKAVEITVISNNTDYTKSHYGVKSIHTFDYFSILKEIFSCNSFISGGGSVLQDVTSTKSLMYYLLLLFVAKLFNKQTAIVAQGIGPINSKWGQRAAKFVLKKVDLITVRDSKSKSLLAKWGIKSNLCADMVWSLYYKGFKVKNDRQQVGIQLRGWKKLDVQKIREIAKAVISSFDVKNTDFVVISLQSDEDRTVCQHFCDKAKLINPDVEMKIADYGDIDITANTIKHLDYLIAMRFHAGLIAIREEVPTVMVSYDPKVEILATDSEIPFLRVEDISEALLKEKIKTLIDNKEDILIKMKQFSSNNVEKSRQNINLLIQLLT